MGIPADFKDLLPPRQAAHGEPDDRDDYLWVYDPQKAEIHLKPMGDKGYPIHDEMAPEVTHPDRYQGYAYAIGGGWRITDEEHRKVEDPYIIKRILAALRNEHPPEPLPSIRYHGDPGSSHEAHADSADEDESGGNPDFDEDDAEAWGTSHSASFSVPPGVDARWLTGACSSYARALQDAAADTDGATLHLGQHVNRQTGSVEHVFAHDDTHAYDALGIHPLPYDLSERGWRDEYHVPEESLSYPHLADEGEIEEAYPEALETWQSR